MAFQGFVEIEGIKGESENDNHKDWIDITSYAIGAEQSPSFEGPGGASGGKPTLERFTFSHLIDRASPKLFESLCKGQHFDKVTVDLARGGAESLTYMRYELEDVMIADVYCEGGKAGDIPSERVALDYARIKLAYTVQTRKGAKGGGQVVGGWDRVKGKVHA